VSNAIYWNKLVTLKDVENYIYDMGILKGRSRWGGGFGIDDEWD
jgi:hypothetical protein